MRARAAPRRNEAGPGGSRRGRGTPGRGAFGYSGKHHARLLLARGERVRNLTGHPDRPDPFAGAVVVTPLRFDDPAAMCAALRDVQHLPGPRRSRGVHVRGGGRALAGALPRRGRGRRRVVGAVVGDVVLTSRELEGLTANLLVSRATPTGTTRFSEWLAGNAERLGVEWASELGRHYR